METPSFDLSPLSSHPTQAASTAVGLPKQRKENTIEEIKERY
jgi:hypothetical protein